jgi:hypothetical protein
MLSPLMIMSFMFLDSGHSVRARGDLNLQQIQKISWMDSPNYTPEIINEFKQLLCTSCTFFSDWDSPRLEQSVIWVFGLHDAVKHAEAIMLQRIKDSNVALLSCSARDKQMSVTAHSDWGSASDAIRRQLDKKCKEPRVLHFYQNALYEMTYNDWALGFSQFHIAMLQKMPTVEEISSFSPVMLLLAPSGCKAIPEGVEQPDDLLHHGWRLVSVGEIVMIMIHTFPHGIKGQRLQYSFHHKIAATVHAIMGSNFNRLITLVSRTDSQYHLWEKEQAGVLLSRMFTSYISWR